MVFRIVLFLAATIYAVMFAVSLFSEKPLDPDSRVIGHVWIAAFAVVASIDNALERRGKK